MPGWLKVKLKVSPVVSVPESNSPLSAVTVWGALSRLVQTTVVPALTVNGAPKANLAMAMAILALALVAVGGTDVAVGGTDVAVGRGGRD